MKTRVFLFSALLGLVSSVTLAQDQRPAVLATYYQCDQNRETALDTAMMDQIGPILDGMVASGEMTGWGWAAHSLGGTWRRLGFYSATSRDAIMDARAKFLTTAGEQARPTVRLLNEVCPVHEDYLFSVAAASPTDIGTPGGAVSLGVYFRCDMAREARADEIFSASIEPVLNEVVQRGEFSNWSYLAHDRGGLIRRVLAIRGSNAKDLLNAFGAAMSSGDVEARREFTEICSSHEDYIWNVRVMN